MSACVIGITPDLSNTMKEMLNGREQRSSVAAVMIAAKCGSCDSKRVPLPAVCLESHDGSTHAMQFALIYHFRNKFPLHYIIFKQTASHLPHEGNTEQLFSRAGDLSDSNGKMDPARLAVCTSIGVNYQTYQPTVKQILERYMLKFGKGGKAKLHEDDLGLVDPGGEMADEGECIEVAED